MILKYRLLGAAIDIVLAAAQVAFRKWLSQRSR